MLSKLLPGGWIPVFASESLYYATITLDQNRCPAGSRPQITGKELQATISSWRLDHLILGPYRDRDKLHLVWQTVSRVSVSPFHGWPSMVGEVLPRWRVFIYPHAIVGRTAVSAYLLAKREAR